MSRWSKYLVVALMLVWVGPAFASVKAENAAGTELGDAHRVRGCGSFVDNVCILADEEVIGFGPAEGLLSESAGGPAYATTTSVPNLRNTDQAVFLEWADGEESPWQVKFRVPDGYVSGGGFKALIAGDSGGANGPAIDFEVFVDKTITAFDTTATNQTPVQLTSAVGSGSPEEKTLAVTTDFGSLVVGDYVTANFWRDDATTGTQNLEVYYVEFYYNGN